MATRFAIASGNWSNGAIWDNGIGPTTGDFVHANGFTVAIDQNVNVGYISNGASTVYVPNIATPLMTSANTPSGVASASTTNGSSFPWTAFDQSLGSQWISTVSTGWLKYQFPTTKIIRRYAIYGSSNQTLNPRNWTFEGSNDDVNWTVLHTVTLPAGIPASTWYNSGVFANSTPYLYYRVNITLTGGGSNIYIVELQMTESTSTSIGNNPNGTFTMPTAYNITCTQTNGILNAGTTTTNPVLTISATTGSIAINSNIRGNGSVLNTNALTISGAGHNITITGDIYGGGAANAWAINRNATGTLTVNGNLFTGTSVATGYALYNTASGTGTINIVGNLTNATNGVGYSFWNLGAATINITGNISGTTTGNSGGFFYNNAVSTINITGLLQAPTNGFQLNYALFNQGNATITINGNILGGNGINNYTINSSSGNIAITGNITGGGSSGNQTINQSGGTLVVNGTVTAGNNCAGITSTATSVSITGDVFATSNFNAVESTSATTLFTFNGSAYGNGYFMPFSVKRLGITANPSMVYRMANNTGAAYNFYPVGSTALGTPATTDVRNGVVYASGALTGTLVVPPATAVTVGVTYDNGTLGTAQNTAASFLAALGTSTDPLAVRLQNVSTVQTTGAQIAAYNV